MADYIPPVFPTPDEEHTLQNVLNIQKAITELQERQSKAAKELKELGAGLEAKITQRLNHEMMLNNQLLDLQKDLGIAKEGVAMATTRHLKKQAKLIENSVQQDVDRVNLQIKNLQILNAYEIDAAKKRLTQDRKWLDFSLKAGKEIMGINTSMVDKYRDIGEELSKGSYNLGEWGRVLAGILYILKRTWDLFVKFDKAAADFRIQFGLMRGDAKQLRSNVEGVAIEMMHVGVTIESAYKAAGALAGQMGSIHVVSKDLVKSVSVLKSQLGVSEEDSAGFLKNMAAANRTTMDTQENMAYVAGSMSAAAGVPLGKVMNDIAKASTTALVMLNRMPAKAVQTTIELRRMGSSLNEAAKTGETLLDFTNSVAQEMEASVLLGRSLNLQKARDLVYSGKLAESTAEIVRLGKQFGYGDPKRMDYFGSKAFLATVGKSADEMNRMMTAEKQWDAARKDPTMKKRIEAYEKMKTLNADTLKLKGEDYKAMVRQQANQERITSISNKWNQILAKISEVFLPIIDIALSVVQAMLPMVPLLMGAVGWAQMLVGRGAQLVTYFSQIGIRISTWVGPFGRIGTLIYANAGRLAGMMKWIGMGAKLFGKWIPVLGWVIIAFQAIVSLWKSISAGWSEIFTAGKQLSGLGKLLMAPWKLVYDLGLGVIFDIFPGLKKGFLSLGDAVFGIWEPFKKFWDWLKTWFFGASPSKVGRLIMKGFSSTWDAIKSMFTGSLRSIGFTILTIIGEIGISIFDALTAPFRNAIAWVAKKLPGMGKFAEKMEGGLGGMLKPAVETKAATAYATAVKVTPTETKLATATQLEAARAGKNETKPTENTFDKSLQDILAAINTLNANLENGKIGFYVDGQLLSATIARQTDFRGGYGVNKSR